MLNAPVPDAIRYGLAAHSGAPRYRYERHSLYVLEDVNEVGVVYVYLPVRKDLADDQKQELMTEYFKWGRPSREARVFHV